MTRDDALKLLGLSGQASAQAIERRYHELYNDYHLRLDQAPTPQLKQLYQGKLQEVEAAYQAVMGEEGKAGVADLPGLTPVYEPRPSGVSQLAREPQRESRAEPRQEPEPREEAQRREAKPPTQEPPRGGWRWVIGVVVGVVVLGVGIWGMGEYQRLERERERLAWEREQAERQRREAEERAAAERRAAEQAKEEERRKEVARRPVEMVTIPAGEFFMGCNARVDTECDDDEKPGRRVYVEAFTIDKTEVTVGTYYGCVLARACTAPGTGGWCNWRQNGRAEHPINCVDWQQAQTYSQWAGKRLPTEAEWEKAARGADGRTYPWGNSWEGAKANVIGSSGTRAVGSYSGGASPYGGALDMSGNVWEWTADWYDTGRNYRAVRGGSWGGTPLLARASSRVGVDPGVRDGDRGVRCAQ